MKGRSREMCLFRNSDMLLSPMQRWNRDANAARQIMRVGVHHQLGLPRPEALRYPTPVVLPEAEMDINDIPSSEEESEDSEVSYLVIHDRYIISTDGSTGRL